MEELYDNITPTSEPSKTIQAINKDTVHRICSGQVILALATAVKELIENSVDAEATVIEVNLREYGSDSIEVIDNGSGVEEHNLEGLTLKYHTSKIRSFSDVLSVSTFGFRGEALSSLCAVSNVTICTRHKSSNCGTKLEYDYKGHIIKRTSCAREIGTTVILKNLFSTLPVRHKEFHRNLKREYSKMCNILYAYCLILENVKILCRNQTKNGSKTNIVSTQSSNSIKDNISCVFGAKQLENLLKIKQVDPTETILAEYGIKDISAIHNPFVFEGYISSCEHGAGRSTTDRQFYFVNSRPCEPTKVMKLVNEIYHQYNTHQYPFVIINIKVEQLNVDVNVTPDKRKVFLNQENLLLSILKSTLVNLFQSIPSTFSLQNTQIKNRNLEQPALNSSQPEKNENKITNMLNKWKKQKNNQTSEIPSTKRTSDDAFSNNGIMKIFLQKRLKIDENFSQDLSEHSSDDDSEVVPKINKNNPEKKCTQLLNNDSVMSKLSKEERNICNIKDENIQNDETSNVVNANEDKKLNIYDVQNEDDSTVEETNVSMLDKVIKRECLETNDEFERSEIPSLSQIDPSSCVYDECVIPERDSISVNVTLESLQEAILQKQKGEKETKSEKITLKFRSEINPLANKNAENELKREISQDKFSAMKIIGQFNLGFIVTQLDQDLFIIDQHASDEKYNFETLQKTTVLENQKLVVPKLLDLTPSNIAILEENIEIFKKNGFTFKIEEEEKKKVYLTTIPISKNWIFGKDDIDEMLFMLQDSPLQMCRPTRIRMMFANRACRKSFMIGTALSKQNMRQIIDHMGEIEQPWNCPHGRPTMRHLVNLALLNNS